MIKKALAIVFVAALAFGAWRIYQFKSAPPVVPFAKAIRQKISNNLSTNGKVEPAEFTEIHSDIIGLIERLSVRQGDVVAKGQVIAVVSQPGLDEDLKTAEARLAQAQADLVPLTSGGRAADLAEIDGNLAVLRTQRTEAASRADSTERLVNRQAATTIELREARDAVSDLDARIQALQQRRGSLVARSDVDGAQARIRAEQAAVDLAKKRIAQGEIASPASGVIYDLPVRAGAYLHTGDLVAAIGTLDTVKVKVFVDEPELGRVSLGQPVRVTWDALPAKEWNGTVGKLPTQIIALGARQVGEVVCTVANPGKTLIPGTNVNAFILTQVVESALTIPKTAVRRERGTGVYVLGPDNTVKWAGVTTGASDALRVEVLGGINEGDAVMLPSDATVHDGDKVAATF